jgi:hypothetical protein
MLGELSGAAIWPHVRLPFGAVAERDRTDVDSDLDFDFFEDLPTTEQPPPEAPPPPKRPTGGPIRPRTPGAGTPLLRMGLLVGGAIVLAVVIVLWVTSCRGDGAKGSYEDYFGDVSPLVQESNSIGQDLASVITSRGTSLDEIDQQLAGLARQQGQVVARASALEPPGSLLEEQQQFVESMQLLESGLTGLQQAFSQVQLASNSEDSGATLALQAKRLVAGEVVYEDLFRARSQEVMQSEGITGVAVPELTFFSASDLVSQASLTQFVNRLIEGGGETGGETPTGLHGNGIEAVRVEPAAVTLSPTEENVILLSENLEFVVSVKNSGEFQETQVPVTLVIQSADGPIRKRETIELVNPNQTFDVVFGDFTDLNPGEVTTLKVSVRPVEGEENTSNNSAEYTVIFTLE